MRQRTDALVLHCTATPYQHGENRETIRAMHIARGFSDIGYHFLIGLDGTLFTGRAIDAVGAHVKNFNDTTLGISYVGGLGPDGKPMDTRTKAQTATMVKLLIDLLHRYPQAVILGHRDLSPDMDHDGRVEANEYIKMCPCFEAGPWAKSLGLPGARYDYDHKKYIKL